MKSETQPGSTVHLLIFRTWSAIVGTVVLLVCCLCFTGCGDFKQPKQDAERIIAQHFQALSTNGYKSAVVDYGDQFFATIHPEEWEQTLEKLTAKLGSFQSYAVVRCSVSKGASTIGSGTTVDVIVQAKYSKYSAQEHFALFKSGQEKDLKIVGHQIRSEGLLKE